MLANPATAATPEALMRSRYTAHVRDDTGHLEATWHDDHRPGEVSHDPTVRWLGLEIVDAPSVGDADAGEVEFIARFRRGNDRFELHERSRFVRVDGAWRYTDGDLVT